MGNNVMSYTVEGALEKVKEKFAGVRVVPNGTLIPADRVMVTPNILRAELRTIAAAGGLNISAAAAAQIIPDDARYFGAEALSCR